MLMRSADALDGAPLGIFKTPRVSLVGSPVVDIADLTCVSMFAWTTVVVTSRMVK